MINKTFILSAIALTLASCQGMYNKTPAKQSPENAANSSIQRLGSDIGNNAARNAQAVTEVAKKINQK